MRVGALPAYPSNALNYNLTWSTEGVINEYIEPCEAIVDGRRVEVPALEEREEFTLDGVLYEAFNTSGGLGTLAETLEGQVRTLNYRTIRYPGHAAIMKALLHDLRLRERRDLLKDILENAVPATMQDVVVIFVTVSGWRDGRLMQETYARKIYAQVLAGRCAAASRSPPRPAPARCSTCWPRATATDGLRAAGRRALGSLPGQPLQLGLRSHRTGARSLVGALPPQLGTLVFPSMASAEGGPCAPKSPSSAPARRACCSGLAEPGRHRQHHRSSSAAPTTCSAASAPACWSRSRSTCSTSVGVGAAHARRRAAARRLRPVLRRPAPPHRPARPDRQARDGLRPDRGHARPDGRARGVGPSRRSTRPTDVSVHDFDGERPRVRYRRDGADARRSSATSSPAATASTASAAPACRRTASRCTRRSTRSAGSACWPTCRRCRTS